MTHKFYQHTSRILNSPAIYPCEKISPSTLLRSLIELSRTICSYRTKLFTTQRRNARDTIRQVGNLLTFFEEIQETIIPESVLLCFSELHFIFQKIRYLLEDCTHRETRVFILAKSRFVASQFRVLIKGIGTALDVLAMSEIDMDIEVIELVRLVRKQSWKAEFVVDMDDELALNRVNSILNQFQSRRVPEMGDIKRVLERLGIQSWTECDEETKFLQEEMNFKDPDSEAGDISLLTSLAAFMSYCRATVFENFEYANTGSDRRENDINSDCLNYLNPEDFVCSISLEIMKDPVTVCTGQTYERASIKKWLKSGHLVCPNTREKLTTTELVPNSALQNLIQQYCLHHGISISLLMLRNNRNPNIRKNSNIALNPAAEEAIKFLARFLNRRLVFGTVMQKQKATYEIRLLSKANTFNRSQLIKSNIIPSLLPLLSSPDPCSQENTISALSKLAKHPNGKKSIVESDGLELILSCLGNGPNEKCRQIAAATIFYLSSVEEFRRVIGESPASIPSLLNLITEGTPRGKKNAAAALFGLMLLPENRSRAICYGAVPLLLSLISSPSCSRDDLARDCLAILGSLAEGVEGCVRIRESLGVGLVRSVLCYSNSRGEMEECVSILLSMCLNDGFEVIRELGRDGWVMSKVYCLMTEGSVEGRRKAGSLIKVLHSLNETLLPDPPLFLNFP